MSHITEQADELRKHAIELLITERAAIDERLAMLGYDGAELPNSTPGKRKSCSVCGSAEHNARRCPNNTTEAASRSTSPGA